MSYSHFGSRVILRLYPSGTHISDLYSSLCVYYLIVIYIHILILGHKKFVTVSSSEAFKRGGKDFGHLIFFNVIEKWPSHRLNVIPYNP